MASTAAEIASLYG